MSEELGECDSCGATYVLGADDHCGECGCCWGHCWHVENMEDE